MITRAMMPAALMFLSAVIGGCSRTSPERAVVDAAAAALGGAAKIQAVKTFTIEGSGTNPNIGQNPTPDAELPVWRVTDLTRTIDAGNSRMRVRLVRAARFPFANATVQRQVQGLDGDVAYNVAADGMATRASDAVARDRRVEMLHHPVMIVRAALDPAATLTNLHQMGNLQVVDLTTARGDRLTVAFDNTSKLPSSVTSMSDHPNLGDVAIETTFGAYGDVNGIKLPGQYTTKLDKYVQMDIQVSTNTVDAGASDLVAPDAVRAAIAPPAVAPVTVDAEQIAKGIWWLAGSGNHRSVVFEFDDHLTLFEVPLNEGRSKAVIDKARTLSSKPLTQVIVSHHHFDHSGGLRVAVAEGLTVVTHKGNEEFFKWLVSRPRTIAPDALAKSPRPLTIQTLDDGMVLKDKTLEVQLYHVKDNVHAGTLVMAYVPRDRILVQADLYDAGWLQYPWRDNFIKNVNDRKLRVDKHVPVHGPIQTYADVLKTMASKAQGAN